DGPLQVEQAAFAQGGDQLPVGLLPEAPGGPLAEPAVAGAARAAAHLGRQGAPAGALAEHEQDAPQAVAVGDARAPALAGGGAGGQVRGDGAPQRLEHRGVHGRASWDNCWYTQLL